MFKTTDRKWSESALRALIGIAITTALLAIPHGVFEGYFYDLSRNRQLWIMLATWTADTRYLFENLLYVATLIFVGAKFFETRTTFAVTFDRLDSGNIRVNGPDEDNIVWLGQRYNTQLEAQTVAASLENRLKESAAV
jgi:hypothetical protein